ncbi:ferredoxin [Sesbania bispinosa]|nr:ferredoxin [Sesbania bispinosa]
MIHYFPVFSLDESTELGQYRVQVPKSLSHIHLSIVAQEMITAPRRINAQKLELPSPSRSAQDAVAQCPRRCHTVAKLVEVGEAARSRRRRCVALRGHPKRHPAVAQDVVTQSPMTPSRRWPSLSELPP